MNDKRKGWLADRYRKSCKSGKKVYATSEGARMAAERRTRQKGLVIRYYECPSCKGWHLTRVKSHGEAIRSLEAEA